jgi:hypothetical protein
MRFNEADKGFAGFLNDFPANIFRFEKEFRDKRRANLAKLPGAPSTKTPEQEIEEAKAWVEKLKGYAEEGRKKLYDTLMEPESSIMAQIKGEEKGDPLALILKRTVGHFGLGLENLLHVVLIKALHLPDMWKFFRHDAFQVSKDFVKSSWMLAKHPTKLRAWGAFGSQFLNLLRLPIAAFTMGVGSKFTYQQYQLIHAIGFTGIDLGSLFLTNAALCWFLFICFLASHWLSEADQEILKKIAAILRNLFPQQMYKEAPKKVGTQSESLDMVMNDDLKFLCEDVSRYSIEVNYRTSKKEVLDSWAKLVLGFVSAALQREGYHVKHVYSEKPLRILVSTNNWDDGSWVALLMYNHNTEHFVISSGFWNKDRRTVSVQRDTGRCAEDTASTLVGKVLNFMHDLKHRDPRKIGSLRPAKMKRGPKK